MLALKDRWHVVNASLPGLADAARISISDCSEALEVLSSPDPHSRTKEFEGRRIEACDGGWIILNGELYRNKMSLDERNEYQRIKQKEYRDRKSGVKSCLQKRKRFTHTDTHTDTDTDTKEKKKKWRFTPPTLQEVEQYCLERKNGINAQTFIDFYKTNGWMQSNKPVKDWQACVRTWEAREKEKNKFTGSTYTGIPRPSKDLYGFQRYLKDNHIQGKPGEENESIYQRLLREARQ